MSGFRPDGTVRIVFRYIKSREPEFRELVLDREPLLHLAQAKNGVLLIGGATGPGKTSTMAAMLNSVNRNLERHLVTIENPIEFKPIDDKPVYKKR